MLPCFFAQVKYGITSNNGRRCPSLIKEGNGYTCTLIRDDPEVSAVLLQGDCDDPEADAKKKFNSSDIVREFFPQASDEEIDYILWNETSYPDFWNIPEDGWTPVACLRMQLQRLKQKAI
jgi:hypothetical protein